MSTDITDSEDATDTGSVSKDGVAGADTEAAPGPGSEGEQPGIRSQAEGGIVAQLRLDHAALFLRPTLRDAPAVTVEPAYWTTIEPGRTVVFVTVYGRDFDPFETALTADPTVTDPVLVDRYSDSRVYRVTLTDRAVTVTAETAALGGRLLDLSSSRDGWLVQLRFPDRERLVAFNDYCREHEISVTVDHLRVSDDESEGVVALTDKQQALLTVAHEEGYFDVPRGISQDELAERLDVSKSAVSQRLRRAIGELCAAALP
ncbi:helix-turn-helix domain-containing protein [Natrinema pallidum]|uniref:Bacterio-opsin activator HTH domain-containing protein n=2 Tax=Natrinema pallidum TaxID=69527 RepID=L9Z3T3_9EURY|nr:helix-turn-helix domain-containing protein [Natrinema pallidum]ELY80536.1 bacterio-opsin activator HTH domain-containing protein [Natrinema pallidum DSM 3751]QCW02535.1 winged helix-turn-helix transcriptional regulator [Natrinema pallidum]